jgi:hypothetical protein
VAAITEDRSAVNLIHFVRPSIFRWGRRFHRWDVLLDFPYALVFRELGMAKVSIRFVVKIGLDEILPYPNPYILVLIDYSTNLFSA